MGKVIDGKVFVAPNGKTKVKVLPHGFVEPVGKISKKSWGLIEYCSILAIELPEAEGNAYKAFKLMGWTEEKKDGTND